MSNISKTAVYAKVPTTPHRIVSECPIDVFDSEGHRIACVSAPEAMKIGRHFIAIANATQGRRTVASDLPQNTKPSLADRRRAWEEQLEREIKERTAP